MIAIALDLVRPQWALSAVKRMRLWAVTRPVVLWHVLLALGGVYALATPAQAAIAVTSAVVTADGDAPFDADNAPGNDSGPTNGVVRTQDSVLYTIHYSASNTDPGVITASLPAGMRWDASATASSVCSGPRGGRLNAAKNVLTCDRQPASAGLESFQALSWVGNVAHGASVVMTAATSDTSVSSSPVSVSATPRMDTRIRFDQNSLAREQTADGSGAWQRRMPLEISLGALLPDSGNFKGYESLQNPVSINVEVQPGATVAICPDGVTCSQPGGPGADVVLQLNNPVTHFLDAASNPLAEPDWRQTVSVWMHVAVPEVPNFPAGVVSYGTVQLRGFAPLGLSGQASAVPEPGYEPGFICPANRTVNATQTCISAAIDRRQAVQLRISGGTVYDGSGFLYGDSNGYAHQQEKVLPGQTFHALMGMANRSVSEEPLTDVRNCVAWDPALLELRAPALLKLDTTVNFIWARNMAAPDVAPADRVLEYSAQPFADNDARKQANCGVAGDGNALWTSDYTALPANAITSVRYAYHPAVPPGRTVGLVLPLQRSVSAASLALADDAPIPWFRQYFSDATGLRFSSYDGRSNTTGTNGGGVVQATPVLVRHRVAVPASVAPGDIFPISVTPRTIGAPIAGQDSAAHQVEITIDFPNAYIQPLESSIQQALPSGARYTLTPADLGADGLSGTSDDGAPAKLVLHLNDLAAPGGAAGPAPYQGHVTVYPTMTFQAQAAFVSPVGSYPLVSLVTADNDASFADYTGVPGVGAAIAEQDRTERVSTVVAGVAGFQLTKALLSGGMVDNSDPANPVTRVTAGEPFTYAISFGNATSAEKGRLRMVDVLPFDGDNRGTTGLGPLQMLGATGTMDGAGQGTIGIEYTTAAGAAVQAAVQMPGNEDASTGVNWTDYTGGAFPDGVTALRFTTSADLQPGYSGIAHLTMRSIQPLTPATELFNDVYGRELRPDGLVLTGSARVKLAGQAAASLTGKVFNDVNMNAVLDAGETGVAGVTATLTCNAGPVCVTGATHTAVTNASGDYSFAPGSTVDGQANFPGLASGSWTLRIGLDSAWTHLGSAAGTVNGVKSGTAMGRSISGIVVPTGATAVDYLFAEHQRGSLTINKELVLPSDVSGPFDFAFTATCDLPTAGFTYAAVLPGYPTNTAVTMEQIPAGANCVVTEDQPLPTAPPSYEWAEPPTLDAVVVPGNGDVAVTVTNALIGQRGNIQLNATTLLPDEVAGPFSFVLTASCDLPTTGTTYSAMWSYPPAVAARISGIPVGAKCSLSQALPDAPAGYRWDAPVLSPATVTVSANTDVEVAVTNMLTKVEVGAVPTAVPVSNRVFLVALAMLVLMGVGVHMRKR